MSYFEEMFRKHNEDIKSTIGPVCKNCHHVIAYEGLVHCAELDCNCLSPEPETTEREVP